MHSINFTFQTIDFFNNLKNRCYEKLESMFSQEQLEKAKERLKKELEIIEARDWGVRFYLAAEMVQAARGNGLVVTHRGGICGSMVAYASGITDINPLDYDLSYESFIGLNGEVEPYFDMNIADNSTRDLMADRIMDVYPEGKIYLSKNNDYPNSIVVIPAPYSNQLDMFEVSTIAVAATNRSMQLLPEHKELLSKVKPLVFRFSVNYKVAMLQKLWQRTKEIPQRNAKEAGDIFKEYLIRKKEEPRAYQRIIPMCFCNNALEVIFEKVNVISLRELIDAYSMACSSGEWKKEMIHFLAEDEGTHKNSIWRICNRENVFEALDSIGVEHEQAYNFMEDVRKGRLAKDKYTEKWKEVLEKITDSHAPKWYIGLLKNGAYLFPRAHCSEYVMTSLQLLWYRMYFPEEFYRAWIEMRKEELAVYENALADKDFSLIMEKYNEEIAECEYYVEEKLKLD